MLNVWLAPFGQLDTAKPITDDKKRGIRQHHWADDGRHILFLQDEGGDENWRVYSVDVESHKQVDLTPLDKVRAEIIGLSHERPDVALIALNDRTPEYHDLYEINISTGERKLVERNDQEFAGYLEDLQLRPRVAVKTLPDGGGEIYRNTGKGWESLLKYGRDDSLTTRPVIVEEGGATALMLSSAGRDKAALLRVDLNSGKQTVVGESDKADVSEVWLEPRTRKPQAFAVEYLTTEIAPLIPAVGQDIERLKAALGPQFEVVSRTLDDTKWVVVVDDPIHVVSSYLYERGSGKVTKLFDARPELAGAPLRPMKPVELQARDGLTLVAYLTLPAGPQAQERRSARISGAPGARCARRSVGARQLRLQQRTPVARQSRLRRAVRQLPRLHRLRQEIHQCGRPRMGPQHAQRPAGCRRLGRQGKDRQPDKIAHLRRLVRRLCHAGRPDVHAGTLRLRRGHRRSVEPVHPVEFHSAVLEVLLRRHGPPDRRSAHARRARAAETALAADLRRQDLEAAADRAGRERPARQAGRGRPDRRRR